MQLQCTQITWLAYSIIDTHKQTNKQSSIINLIDTENSGITETINGTRMTCRMKCVCMKAHETISNHTRKTEYHIINKIINDVAFSRGNQTKIYPHETGRQRDCVCVCGRERWCDSINNKTLKVVNQTNRSIFNQHTKWFDFVSHRVWIGTLKSGSTALCRDQMPENGASIWRIWTEFCVLNPLHSILLTLKFTFENVKNQFSPNLLNYFGLSARQAAIRRFVVGRMAKNRSGQAICIQ